MGYGVFYQAGFEIFAERLLLKALDDTPWEAHSHIMKEADVAADIAVRTAYPYLVFPCLLEERVAAYMLEYRRREAAYWSVKS